MNRLKAHDHVADLAHFRGNARIRRNTHAVEHLAEHATGKPPLKPRLPEEERVVKLPIAHEEEGSPLKAGQTTHLRQEPREAAR